MHLQAVVTFLNDVEEREVAESVLDAFAKRASTLEQYDELAMLYEKIKAYSKSYDMLQDCLALAPTPQHMYSVRSNMAKVLNHLNEPHSSLFYSNLNAKINPSDYEIWMELAFSLYLMGDTEASWRLQSKMLDDHQIPDEIKKRISFNMGTFDMAQGRFKEGLYKMIMGGKEIGIWKPVIKPFARWDGKPTDKTLLVFAEAGIGDEIINIRFMHHLKERGIKARWVGLKDRDSLYTVFRRNGFDVIYETDLQFGFVKTTDFVYCDAMALPILLNLEKEELWKGAYLQPDPKKVEEWRHRLPEKFVTMRWSGNPLYDQDLHRSVDLRTLHQELMVCGLPIVSLQVDAKVDEPYLIQPTIESWEDTLAIQHLAHLNVTSCTSTAHSASAMGAKTVVLPPICTYYPWLTLRDDETSYWYAQTTKVYRQTEHKDWSGPLSNIRDAYAELNNVDTKL